MAFHRSLKHAGILSSVYGPARLRMVTHYGIERSDIDETLERARQCATATV